jgi:uncharacterized protein with HEPN domain
VRTPDDRIKDILAAIADSRQILDAGHTSFLANPLMIRAAKNIISEIGEAAKGIPDEMLADMPGVPWKSVKGMRDKVVHDYPELDLDVMWETLLNGLPAVEQAIRNSGWKTR